MLDFERHRFRHPATRPLKIEQRRNETQELVIKPRHELEFSSPLKIAQAGQDAVEDSEEVNCIVESGSIVEVIDLETKHIDEYSPWTSCSERMACTGKESARSTDIDESPILENPLDLPLLSTADSFLPDLQLPRQPSLSLILSRVQPVEKVMQKVVKVV